MDARPAGTAAPGPPPSPQVRSARHSGEPPARNARCSMASRAAYCTADGTSSAPLVSTSSTSRSKSVRWPTRVSSTTKLARVTGL